MKRGWRWTEAALVAALAGSFAQAQTTARVSVSSTGTQSDQVCAFPAISADGRFVAFQSSASNLGPGDTNDAYDVFVRDRLTGSTERVSVDSAGVQGDQDSFFPSISADGRFVAFESFATNLVAGDGNGTIDVFVRDRLAGTTELVSLATGGAQGNSSSYFPSISADGRLVGFTSSASNLVAGDTNGVTDAFVRDRQAGATARIDLGPGGLQANGPSELSSISADGRFAAFASTASNLVPGDTNGFSDVFVRDLQAETTERASVSTAGAQGNSAAYSYSISGDGRFATFYGNATNLVAGDTNGVPDVFVRDRQLATTERVSVATGGAQGNGRSDAPRVSADGHFVAFFSEASNLAPGDTNGSADVFVRDLQQGTTERVSVSTDGTQGNSASRYPAFSSDGRFVAFDSSSANLVLGDTNGVNDVFVRDRFATGFASLCEPGLAGVIPCPCANAPAGAGRGCDNSSFSGGAALTASGVAYLAADSLVFTTSGETPVAPSILLQGDGLVPSGAVFGQGVRCAGGGLLRLFTKVAAGGSISAPELGAGDPTVTARSAALGDFIQAGETRYYLVYYRDPVVLGGCPSTSTFNATQTGSVTYWP
jgi:Tol biopolymer transport system component